MNSHDFSRILMNSNEVSYFRWNLMNSRDSNDYNFNAFFWEINVIEKYLLWTITFGVPLLKLTHFLPKNSFVNGVCACASRVWPACARGSALVRLLIVLHPEHSRACEYCLLAKDELVQVGFPMQCWSGMAASIGCPPCAPARGLVWRRLGTSPKQITRYSISLKNGNQRCGH